MREMTIAVVSHFFTHGGQDCIVDYLNRRRLRTVILLSHPLPDYGILLSHSILDVYENGERKSQLKIRRLASPEVLLYLKDTILTLTVFLRMRRRFHIFIGSNAINTLSGLILQKLRLVGTVIFYSHSYVPQRFNNSIKNWIYHFLDKLCIQHCNAIWNVSRRLSKVRMSQGVPKFKNIVVPEAIDLKEPPAGGFPPERETVVFLGHLSKNNGVDILIQAMRFVLDEIKDAKLVIIGVGEKRDSLQEAVSTLGLIESVVFLGYIPYKKALNIMRNYAVGVAPYAHIKDSSMWTADPSKPKDYMSCGLPVIMTRVGETYEDIERNGCGIIVNSNVRELARAMIKLLSDDDFYYNTRENVIKKILEYDILKVHSRVWKETLSCLSPKFENTTR